MINKVLHSSRVVVFDFDETIADQQAVIREATRQTLAHYHATDVDVGSVAKDTDRDALFAEHIPQEHIREAKAYYKSIWNDVSKEHIAFIPHAKEMLQALKDKGYKLAVLSDKEEPRLANDVACLGLDGMFDVVVGTNALRDLKPNSDGMSIIKHKLGKLDYSDFVYLGDDIRDLQLAQSLTIPAIFIHHKGFNDDVLEKIQAGQFPDDVHIINDWQQLIDVVEQQESMIHPPIFSQQYTRRMPNSFPDVISDTYYTDIKNAKDPSLYLTSYAARKGKYRDDLADESCFPILPEGFSREMAGQPINDDHLRMQYAVDVTNSLLHDEMLQRIATNVNDA